jgi:hypothetical protein
MRLTKLDLKQIIQEEMQNLLEKETPTLRQKFEVGPEEIEEGSIITDFSTNEIGRTAPPGVPEDEWSGVGTSIAIMDAE